MTIDKVQRLSEAFRSLDFSEKSMSHLSLEKIPAFGCWSILGSQKEKQLQLSVEQHLLNVETEADSKTVEGHFVAHKDDEEPLNVKEREKNVDDDEVGDDGEDKDQDKRKDEGEAAEGSLDDETENNSSFVPRYQVRKPLFVASGSLLYRYPRRRNRILRCGNLATIAESGVLPLPSNIGHERDDLCDLQSTPALGFVTQNKLRWLSHVASAGDGPAQTVAEQHFLDAPPTEGLHVSGKCQESGSAHQKKSKKKDSEFDTVAVSFWLAELQFGSSLLKLKNVGGVGRQRTYVVKVNKSGQVILKWTTKKLYRWTAHAVELKATEVINAEQLEFRMSTSKAEIIARAPDEDTFSLWTHKMASIFLYTTNFSQRFKLQLVLPPREETKK